MIIACIGLDLDVVSSYNVFSNLIYVFRCKGIILLNQLNFIFHCQQKKKKNFFF